ncbi:MAG: hypothetical protein GXP10_05325 [Gammaproteobacteria bacterium]|nr:hypothetical protein [Gammaproteobacteria bacterium]
MNRRIAVLITLAFVSTFSFTHASVVSAADSSKQRKEQNKEPQQLGRLFFTLDQRRKIDALRKRMRVGGKGEIKTLTHVKRPNKTITMHGYIVRERAETVVWSDNRNTLNGAVKNASATISGAVHDGKISVSVSGSHLSIKAGQKLLLGKNRVIEGYLGQATHTEDSKRSPDG